MNVENLLKFEGVESMSEFGVNAGIFSSRPCLWRIQSPCFKLRDRCSEPKSPVYAGLKEYTMSFKVYDNVGLLF